MKFPARPPPVRWRVTALLAIGAMLNYGDRSALSSVLPALHEDLGFSDVALGMLGSLFLWSYAIGSPIAGSLADRFSRSRLITYSLSLWSLVMVLTGAANGAGMFFALRVCLGFTECIYIPAAIALIADHHAPPTRARAMSALLIGISFGVVAAGTFSGILADHYGWRSAFWVLGAAGLALAGIFRFFLIDGPAASRTPSQRPCVAEALRYLIRVPSYFILLAKVILAGVSLWMFFNWLPLYFNETFHMDLGAAGFVGTFTPEISAVLGVAAGGWISDRIAVRNMRHRMFAQGLGYLVAAPFLLAFLGRPNFTEVTMAVSAFGLFRGLSDANEQSILCEIVPSRLRSTAVGIMNTCATVAGGLGVFLAGLFKQELGLNTIFASTSVLFVIAAAILFIGYYAFMARDIARARAADNSTTLGELRDK